MKANHIAQSKWRIYASVNYAIIGSDNGLSHLRLQAIIWTNTGILLIRTLGTKLMNLKHNSYIFFQESAIKNGNCSLFYLGLSVLIL